MPEPGRVLLVEDDEDVREVARMALEIIGHLAVTAGKVRLLYRTIADFLGHSRYSRCR